MLTSTKECLHRRPILQAPAPFFKMLVSSGGVWVLMRFLSFINACIISVDF